MILPTFKEEAYKRIEASLLDFEKEDLVYKNVMDNVAELRNKYEQLELQLEHKEIIESLLCGLDELELEQSKIAYLIGVTDGMLLLDKLDLLKD